MYTHPHVADVFLVAYGLVGLVDGWRTLGATSVAKARVSATVVVPALIAVAQGATGCAARTLGNMARMNDAAPLLVYTQDMEQTRKKRVSSCAERVYVTLDRLFSSFFFQLVEKYECVRARWMCTALKRGQSHCENAFISAFNVYIVHDIGFGSLEIFSGT